MALLIATGNAGKLAEFRRLLRDIEIVGAADVGLGDLKVSEDGDCFRDNALLKARAYAQAAGCMAVADDSGLEVDALDGEPGVQSARFGGPGLTDADRCQLLIERLQDLPTAARTARFRCHLIATTPDGVLQVEATGTCEGQITTQLQGDGGFGYDPVFLVPNLQATLAQIAPEEKNRISHRGQAIGALRAPLLAAFPELAH
ncbi:MAG: RdgB/HAM1 family non-canonical purine NTP pyrophosphatase [Gemmatimonadetes bacterium]|jgi:XTP/dITP diphosphohydrolase|nr:RdgB/HAM1 family non-canonical purine NTP pyrophosphatase [Gemmatimonadota bacterium]MBT7861968.1 RdgB/HAM1 family non-canonical purine NTP pyrophosphatase [Gemmatimonadota bacterium]